MWRKVEPGHKCMPWPVRHNRIYLCDQGDVDQFIDGGRSQK